MNMRDGFRSFVCSLALLAPTIGYGDDTDIYFNPNPTANVGEPMVMLTIDLKANNLSSSYCTYDGSGADDCFTKLGAVIYPFLKKANDDYSLNYAANGVNRFDAFRAVHAALYSKLQGVKVGMMLSHNEQSADAGYILQGFRSFQAGDANGAKAALLTKLYSLPNPKGATAAATSPPTPPPAVCTGASSANKTLNMTGTTGMTFTVTDATAFEGSPLVFTVTGSGTNTTNGTLTLNVTTVNDTAGSPGDYTAVSTAPTVKDGKAPFTSFNPDQPSFTVSVPTVDDSDTASEQMKLHLSMSTTGAGATTKTADGIGTICAIASGISVADTSVAEGGNMVFTVSSNVAAPAGGWMLTYQVTPGTAATPADYNGTVSPLTGSVTIPAGQKTATITIKTVTDAIYEGNETLTLQLLTAPAGITLSRGTAQGIIIDAQTCSDGGSYDHKYQGAELYFEFSRYLTGGPILKGHLGAGDYGSNSATNLDTECYPPGGVGALKWDSTIESGANYVSPLINAGECTKVYAINMMFGVSNQDNALNATIGQPKSSYGLGTTPGNSNSFADMISLLGRTDLGSSDFPTWSAGAAPSGTQNVNTFIVKLGGPAGQFAPYSAAGASVIVGDEDNLQLLLDQLLEVFRQILSVSTTFVSASVPVDVFNRANINDNVYIAVFAVDELTRPAWYGNIKKLRLGKTTINGKPTFFLHDVLAPTATAIGLDGRIRFDALTYWTAAAALPDAGTLYDVDAGDEQPSKVNGRDGRFVARGGAGHRIPGFTAATTAPTPGNPGLDNTAGPRKVYTDVGGALVPLDVTDANAALLQGALGAATTAEAKQLICFARGIGNCPAVVGSSATPIARNWIVGDALHSRPTPLNYGARSGYSRANPDIRVLMGSNEGAYHMFRNTVADTTCGDADFNGIVDGSETPCTESGVESWAYIPSELLGIQKPLMANAVGIYPPHPIGVDGETVLYTDAGADKETINAASGDKAWAFFGLRRGGKAYYALDVSDPSTPVLKWKITNTTPGFERLSLAFSTPQLAKVQYGGVVKPVLIFGAGYYGGWSGSSRIGYDNTATPVVSAPEGNAVYIVDADTGALIWKAVPSASASLPAGAVEYVNAALTHSVSAEVNIFDSNNDDVDDRAYVPDLGGNVWRIDLPRNAVTDNRATWQIVRLAALGGSGVNDRRFANAVDVVLGKDTSSGTTQDIVLLGSGDRENPKETTVENYFFTLKDTSGSTIPNPVTLAPYAIGDLVDANCFLPFAPQRASCNSAEQAKLANGWKLKLIQPGEKALASAITLNNQTFFTTYLPQGEPTAQGGVDTCAASEGTGRLYAVGLYTGSPVLNLNGSDDSGNQSASTLDDRFNRITSKGIPSELVPLGTGHLILPDLSIIPTGGASHYRTYWFEKNIDD